MRAINHAATGAIIGLTIGNPVVALPLALISHFVLDAVPHHGWTGQDKAVLKRLDFKAMLIIDALLCFGLVLILFIIRPSNWLVAIIGAFLAASPDLYSLPRFLKSIGKTKSIKWDRFRRFHKNIQWFERPIGVVVEIAVFIGAGFILFTLLK